MIITVKGRPSLEQVEPFFGTSYAMIGQLKRVNGNMQDVNFTVRNGNIVAESSSEIGNKFLSSLVIPERWDKEALKELTNHYNMRVCSTHWEATALKSEYPNSFTIENKIYYP